jgi:uncharacterized protein (TIGR00251 family)
MRTAGVMRFASPFASNRALRKTRLPGYRGVSLKVRVTAPPVDGLANEALIDSLSAALTIPRRNVCIISGLSSRTKVVEVRGVELEKILQLTG